MEIWKYIRSSVRCDYYVSDLGRVKSVLKISKRENYLIPAMKKRKAGGSHARYTYKWVVRIGDAVEPVKLLVSAAFMPRGKGESPYVYHIDGNLENCRLDNLKRGVSISKEEQVKIFTEAKEAAWSQHPEFEKNLIDYILTDNPTFLSKAWIAATPGLKTVVKGQIVKYRGFVPCMAQVHDVLQETFCVLVEQIKKGNVRNPEKLWGYVVAVAKTTTIRNGKQNQHFSVERNNSDGKSYSLYDISEHNNQDYAYTPAWGL